ncbi:hypothetical protein AERO8C_50559 [Aeromonas veronii]|uniref:Uncharacterized protein n=1 Tax=Aeromonas veronii TaxID=654 RepID=A0A653L979_AERVE|nr:hypothetical protein AERO8C_50559 [Aeromonas veronii]
MDRRPIYQARGRCKQQDPAKQCRPQGMRGPSGWHGSHSEATAILLVIDLVHVPLHQAVELLHGIFDKWQRARQDPLEVTAQGLLDPVRFEGVGVAHDGAPLLWFSRSSAVLS